MRTKNDGKSFFTSLLKQFCSLKLKKYNCCNHSVYADKEERIAGGGCLELKKNVAKLLGLDEKSISGN